MKLAIITKTIVTALVCACAFVLSSPAQLPSSCKANDADCLKAEKLSAKSAAKFKAVKFVPDRSGNAIKTPTPTPTPADQTAAPAKPPSNGSNPAELITRVEVKYQFQNFAAGYLHAVPIIRADYAFTPTVSFRVDLPVMVFDPKSPSGKTESGIGDVVVSMTFVKPISKKLILAFVPRIDLPTATHDSMGSGKYSFKPLFAMVTPIGKWGGFVQVLEYRMSFAGDKTRSDINEFSIKPIILKSFTSGPLKGYYANPKAEIIVDFAHNNKTILQIGAEFGKAVNKNLVLFAVPTFHVAGTKRESFKLEVGFRYLFR